MDYRCYECLMRSYIKLIEQHHVAINQRECLIKEFMAFLSGNSLDLNTPEVSRDIHRKIKQLLNDDDPYKEIKRKMNDLVLKKYTHYKVLINNSENSFQTALKLSIAGNIIDYGANPEFDLDSTIQSVLNSHFRIDQSNELYQDIMRAKSILFLGDNAGEIVFDKLFIETLPYEKIIYAVRGDNIINDVTLTDAYDVGLDKIVKVISNGYDAPSTLLNKVSNEFMHIYNAADFIISKGQGNLEGLINETNKPIYFLLMVKCNTIGEKFNVQKGDYIIINNQMINEKR